jgi:hypothetical protein
MILYVLLLSLYFYRVLQNSNSVRHLDNTHNFAHFSKINNKNFFVYPELLLASPRHFILNEGDSLYIPANWWHWIRSEKSIAINSWCLDNYEAFTEPRMLRFEIVNKDLIANKINTYNGPLTVWNSYIDKQVPGTIKTDKGYNYVITVPGYGDSKERLNVPLLDHVKDCISNPPHFKDKDIESNLFISSGNHDTGLHYDDNAGILSVLKGKKYITLYPPHNSSYLHPYNVIPDWAKTKPYRVEYNLLHLERELKNALPSSRLLYESLHNAKYRSNIMREIQNVPDKSVWGCKKEGNYMRWEVYQYQFDINDSSICSPLLTYKNIVVTSKDVYDTPGVIGDEDHIYTCDNGNMDFPFFGHGYKNEDEPESVFVIDNKQRFKENFIKYTRKLGFGKNVHKFHSYLDHYSAKDLCIFNKFKDQIFIMYFGLKVEEFLYFLSKFDYDTHLIKHVLDNMHMYRDICHEIAIVYDIKTGEPVRSGFYGILMK